MTTLNRRELGIATTAGAALTMLGHPSEAADDKRRPWIDAHSHIWTPDVEKFPLANGKTITDLAPPSFTAEELLKTAHPHGVGRVVLIQHYGYHGWDNSYLIDAARRYPREFRVVGMVDTFSPKPGQQMRELLKKKVTGFRITPKVHEKKWLAGGMDEMWRTAADTGQNICCLIHPRDIAEVHAMSKRHEGTKVVIDHFARVGVDGTFRRSDLDALCAMAKQKNTYVKISAFYALGNKQPPYNYLVPSIRRLLDAFGVERLMWASDAPYQINKHNSYAASIDFVKNDLKFLSDGDRQWLMQKTAEKVFFFV